MRVGRVDKKPDGSIARTESLHQDVGCTSGHARGCREWDKLRERGAGIEFKHSLGFRVKDSMVFWAERNQIVAVT